MKKTVVAVLLAWLAVSVMFVPFAAAAGDSVFTPQGGKYTITHTNQAVKSGEQYTILVLKGNLSSMPASVATGDVMYVDQATAGNGSVAFENFIPMNETSSTVFIAGGYLAAPERLGMVAVSAEELKKGDVSGDGSINMTDVLMIYQHFRGKVLLLGTTEGAADVNGDKKINIQDVLLVYQLFRGKIAPFS